VTLGHHIDQESFVGNKINFGFEKLSKSEMQMLDQFYKKHEESDDYMLIFNFLYGDEASDSLGFSKFGISPEGAGFKFAKFK